MNAIDADTMIRLDVAERDAEHRFRAARDSGDVPGMRAAAGMDRSRKSGHPPDSRTPPKASYCTVDFRPNRPRGGMRRPE